MLVVVLVVALLVALVVARGGGIGGMFAFCVRHLRHM